ncbi:hypothetical protein Bbelb_385940 [Branchiostoma belcheri]|nr:hypothetical protein Bbelb_385940 [Branchiostoma belcheri]
MEVQFKLQVRDFVEWDVQRYHRPQKATVVDPYPSPHRQLHLVCEQRWLRVLQYCQLIIPHVILGVLRHGSSPRQPRLGWYDHRLYRQEVYLEKPAVFELTPRLGTITAVSQDVVQELFPNGEEGSVGRHGTGGPLESSWRCQSRGCGEFRVALLSTRDQQMVL